MRKKIKLFIVYFPVILVSCQVTVNLMSFIWHDGYVAAGFYLNTLFGVNFLFAGFLLSFTYWFRFCHCNDPKMINNIPIKERMRWMFADIMLIPGFLLCCVLILFGVVEFDDPISSSEKYKRK